MGKRVRNIPVLVDLPARFRMMDEFGEYRQVISLPSPPLEAFAGPEISPHLARIANDGMAELVDRYPGRFVAFAGVLPMNNVREAEKELERVMTLPGARGVQLYSNVAGRPLDGQEFRPLFDELARRAAVIWLHPTRGAGFPDYHSEDRSMYEIWWTFGW